MVMPSRSVLGVRMTPTVAMVPIGALVPHRTRRQRSPQLAAVIPGDSVIETTTVGGFYNFFNIYQNVIIARILLSWFPGIAQQPFLRPIYTICDPYLNTFRNVVPPIFGLDLSPILALFLLQALGSASLALGAEEGGPPRRPQRPLGLNLQRFMKAFRRE